MGNLNGALAAEVCGSFPYATGGTALPAKGVGVFGTAFIEYAPTHFSRDE